MQYSNSSSSGSGNEHTSCKCQASREQKEYSYVKMKHWLWVLLIGSLIMLVILGNGLIKNSLWEKTSPNHITLNLTNPLEWIYASTPLAVDSPKPNNGVISSEKFISSLYIDLNISQEVRNSLCGWNYLKYLINHSQSLPNAVEAVREAQVAWKNLMNSFSKENGKSLNKSKKKQCPYFVNEMNATAEFGDSGYQLRIPCGLIDGSAITIIGIPSGLLGNFRIDLAGEPLAGEPEPPIILHYNVRLMGDKLTEDPVIVQNTWTAARDWADEQRCPSPNSKNNKKVDDLTLCNEIVGRQHSKISTAGRLRNQSSASSNKTNSKQYFPFKQWFLSVMTLRVGEDGIHMTVDGKHITSFAFRESLEPWLVSELKISGDLKLASVLVSGLPSSDEPDHFVNLDEFKSVQLAPHQPLDLFVGVFSTANNFKRRMAVRKAWMQYPAVRSGIVAVRFFVGMHKNNIVNEELWLELGTYGDVQLMPFVDYYTLITWKTIAICIFGTEVVSAKYVMKTDDDAFVRVDEVLASLNRSNSNSCLIYGQINSDARPHRDVNSKWYISEQEWPADTYPPLALGPGYVISQDIAKEICNRHRNRQLKMFKLEDVAMGIWISEMKKEGLPVNFVHDRRINNVGCEDGYVVAHYQSPIQMLCLWKNLKDKNKPCCCS